MSSSTAKKKTGAKDRGGAEGAASVASVQSAFTSAARATIGPIDSAALAANVNAAAATAASASPLATYDSPRAFTAAANAICGRPFGATQLDDPWSLTEVVPCVHDKNRLLPSSPAWEPERVTFERLFATGAARTIARPDSSIYGTDTDGFTRASDALYVEWLAHAASQHSSPLLYPHHTLHFDATPMLPPAMSAGTPTSPFLQVAGVLHRLLTAYVERCSESGSVTEARRPQARVPSRVFAGMLYTSVYNNNFSGPAAETKDVAFGLAEVVGEPMEEELPAAASPQPTGRPRRYDALSVVSCLGAAHLCVCAGQRYYKLSVVDEFHGRLRSVAAIAAALEAIHQHEEETKRQDPLRGAAPAVQRDQADMTALLAHLSALPDSDAFEVRRRLRDASGVNACSLDTLQEGLCTLVLKDGEVASDIEGAADARWLHSVCSLSVSLQRPLEWKMRLQAAVVPCQAGLEWIARAAADTCPAPRTTTNTTTLPTLAAAAAAAAAAEEEDEKASDTAATASGAPNAAHALSAAMLSTPVDEEGLATYLELWLPEKHRLPLRPYPAPVWDPESTQTELDSMTAAAPAMQCNTEDLLMALLRAVVKAKRAHLLPTSARGSEGQWPRVVLAVQPYSGGAPSLLALQSPAIQHYYEALAARPMLFAQATRQRIEAAAIAEVRAVLNIAWHTATTVQTSPPGAAASSWWGVVADHPVDLCLSVAVLLRPVAAASPSPARTSSLPPPPSAVRRVVSCLGLSATLLVNCTAQQTAAEVHLRASTARVVDAVVQTSTPASLELGSKFRDILATCT